MNTRHLPRTQFQQRFAVTYVTGSHSFKTGLLFRQMNRGDINSDGPEGGNDVLQYGINAMEFRFRRGVPNQVTILDSPWNYEEDVRDIPARLPRTEPSRDRAHRFTHRHELSTT